MAPSTISIKWIKSSHSWQWPCVSINKHDTIVAPYDHNIVSCPKWFSSSWSAKTACHLFFVITMAHMRWAIKMNWELWCYQTLMKTYASVILLNFATFFSPQVIIRELRWKSAFNQWQYVSMKIPLPRLILQSNAFIVWSFCLFEYRFSFFCFHHLKWHTQHIRISRDEFTKFSSSRIVAKETRCFFLSFFFVTGGLLLQQNEIQI